MLDHLICDCDGVLVDSEPLSMRVDVRILAENGVLKPSEAQRAIEERVFVLVGGIYDLKTGLVRFLT